MRPFHEQSPTFLTSEENRLETPAMAGYRRGMSSSSVIGRKLSAVYNVDRELPEEMDNCLQQLHGCRLGQTG